MSDRFTTHVKSIPHKSQTKDDPQTQARLTISTETESGLKFSIVAEDYFTYLFKKLRVLKEIEIGDLEFDDVVYILGDEPALKELAEHSPAFKALCIWVAENKFKLKFSKNQVKLTGVTTNEKTDPLIKKAKELIGAALKELATSAVFKRHPAYLASSYWNFFFVVTMSLIIVITLAMSLGHISPHGEDFRSDFFIWGAGTSFVASLCISILWSLVRGRHSNAHIQLGWMFLVSFFLCWIMFTNWFDDLNRSIDQAPGVPTTTTLERKWVQSSKHGTYPMFRFCFNPTLEMNFKRKVICVNKVANWEYFHSLKVGGPGPQLRVFPGYFGVQWFRVE